jgi:hypothetical protein
MRPLHLPAAFRLPPSGLDTGKAACGEHLPGLLKSAFSHPLKFPLPYPGRNNTSTVSLFKILPDPPSPSPLIHPLASLRPASLPHASLIPPMAPPPPSLLLTPSYPRRTTSCPRT